MAEKTPNAFIQWAELDGYKKAFIESMEENREQAWLWMYFSGFSVEAIAEEYNCPKGRVHMSLKQNIEKYNQYIRAEKERRETARLKTSGQLKKENVNRTSGKEKSGQTGSPKRYCPKKQSKRLYSKLKNRIDAQFDKKFYIGDIPVSEEEYEELLEYTKFQLNNVSSSTLPLNDAPVLAVALVQIGIHCYNNGNFWDNALKQELKVENKQSFQRFLGDSFIRTLKKHEKYILDESEKVQTILFHSFVTNFYSKGLFELLFQYYSKDLERDIYRNDKAQMQALMDTLKLRSEMTDEENSAFTSQFTGKGSRAYKLRQHTLQAISANPNHSSMRLRRILRLMDKAFWKDIVPQKPVSRLTILFKEWLKESPSFKNEYRLYKSGVIRNRGKKHFSSPYLFADIRNTKFTLVLPAQIVCNEQSEGLFWHVAAEGNVYDEPVDTYPVLTGFKTEEVKIPIPTDLLFSTISCSLCKGETVVRNFSDLPKANVRIFDMEGDYATRIFKIPMCAYTRNDYVIKSTAPIDKIALGKLTRWDLDFVNGDILIFPDRKSLIVGERYIDGLATRGVVEGANYIGDEEKNIPVYDRIPDLIMTLQKSKIAGTVLDINGTRYKLGECERDEFEAADSRGMQAFLIPVRQFCECRENALNRIILDIPGSTFTKQYLFVYIPGLQATFGGAPYVFEERGTLSFPETIDTVCTNRNVEPIFSENGFQFPLTESLRTISVRINKSVDIAFDVPVLLWSFNGETWNREAMGDIWYSDFLSHRQLLFRSPNPKIELSMDDDFEDGEEESEQHMVTCEKRGDGTYILDLTRFHSWINRDKIAHRVNMRLGHTDYQFAMVYARSFVASCDLIADYETGQLTCKGEFIGRGDYYADITHLQTGEKVAEKGHVISGELKLFDRLRNGEYQVDFFETDQEDDFFDEPSYLPIHSFKKYLINRNDFSGNQIQVSSFRPKQHSRIYTSLNRPLWITDIERVAPLTYEGHIDVPQIGNLPVKVIFENEKDLRHFCLYYWDDYDEAYVDFLFDNLTRNLVLEEEPGLKPSVRYRRYKMLFDTDYLFYGSVEDQIQVP